MTTSELKQNIHKLIDNIDDQKMLEEVQVILSYATSSEHDWDELPENVKQAIEEGLRQLDKGQKVSYDAVREKHAKWFTK